MAALLAGAAGVFGCGPKPPPAVPESLQPLHVEASGAEQTLLEGMPGDGSVAQASVAGQQVWYGAVYLAASGRRCRTVMFEPGRRLACEFEGNWRFVPDVLVSPSQVEATQ